MAYVCLSLHVKKLSNITTHRASSLFFGWKRFWFSQSPIGAWGEGRKSHYTSTWFRRKKILKKTKNKIRRDDGQRTDEGVDAIFYCFLPLLSRATDYNYVLCRRRRAHGVGSIPRDLHSLHCPCAPQKCSWYTNGTRTHVLGCHGVWSDDVKRGARLAA